MNHSTIRKLQKIIKQGHIPCRGEESYTKTYKLANCFEHACFNLSNLQLKYSLKEADTNDFSHFQSYNKDKAFDQITNYLKETGLQIERCSQNKILKSNQWIVAIYFEPLYPVCKDYHFLLKEKDGTWSGKVGFSEKIETFKTLPIKMDNNCFYEFYDTFCLTNPFAEENKDSSEEINLSL